MKSSFRMKPVPAALALLAVAGFLAAGEARAQGAYERGYMPSWYVLPSYVGMDPDSNFGTNHRGDGGGLRVGKSVAPSWDIQFGPAYARSHDGSVNYRQTTFGVDALYLFSRDRLRPFVMIGGGAQYDRVSRNNFSADHVSPYVSAGAGLQYSFSPQWGMQVDIRRAYAWLQGNDFGFSHSNTDTVNVGLTFAFDRPVPPRAAQAMPPPVPPTPAPAVAVNVPVAPMPPAPARFEKVTLSSTELFGFDSATLRLPQPKLDAIADALSRNPQVANVTITGYTDRLGSDRYNMALSQRRAASVKPYLAGRSVDAKRLSTVARGEQDPVVKCDNRVRADLVACLEPNRRVEIGEFVVERRVP
jgi:OOP family OmpA-OmpF porin